MVGGAGGEEVVMVRGVAGMWAAHWPTPPEDEAAVSVTGGEEVVMVRGVVGKWAAHWPTPQEDEAAVGVTGEAG